MDLFENQKDWTEKLNPILIKYKGRKHPLEYQNLYQYYLIFQKFEILVLKPIG